MMNPSTEAPGTPATAGAGRAGGQPDAGRSARCNAHHPAFPRYDELRRVWPLADLPPGLRGPDLARVAHHEAGHVVLMEWCGIPVSEATAAPHEGLACIAPDDSEPLDLETLEYDKPLAAAQLGAMYHAGIVAELMHAGHPWRGVAVRWKSRDWQSACTVLQPHFGHGLAGHGFAQRTALAVLSRQWPRVQEIAQRLVEDGKWTPEPTT